MKTRTLPLIAALFLGSLVAPAQAPVVAPTPAPAPSVPVVAVNPPGTTTVSTLTLPTFVFAGASYNQLGNPSTNFIAGAIYPTGVTNLEYTATVFNLLPKKAVDATTGKSYYTLSAVAQQDVFKQVYKSGKFTLLMGGGVGAAFSSASPSGTNVNFSAGFTAVPAFQISPKWAIAVPVQAIYNPSGWNFVPAVALVFKP